MGRIVIYLHRKTQVVHIFFQNAHISGRSYGAFVKFTFYFYKQIAPHGAALLFSFVFFGFFSTDRLISSKNKIFEKYKHLHKNDL